MTTRFGRVQKATALVPLALLSAAWTAGLAGAGGVATVSASTQEEAPTSLPDGTELPSAAIEAPASLSNPGVFAPGVPSGRAGAANVIKTASTNGIPAAALAAYQRGATVINAADAGCAIPWQLIAAIGRVESDHGRYGGNVLSEEGVSTPGIYGIPLNGKRNTQAISDTDAGELDNDDVWDRAVGPMQFIPSTWSVVGVDADGNGTRDPQDVDDAALATAVYLCSGDEDLSEVAGQRTAVKRYNNSDSYVDLVLSIMRAYETGDFTSVPTSTRSSSYFVPAFSSPDGARGGKGAKKGAKKGQTARAGGQPTTAGSSGGGSGGGGSSDGGGSSAPSAPAPERAPAPAPAPKPTKQAGDAVEKVTEAPARVREQVEKAVPPPPAPQSGGGGDGLSAAEARAKCLAQGITTLQTAKLTACISDLVG